MEDGYDVGGQTDHDGEELVYAGGEFDTPPSLSPPHIMDISSVRRVPTSAMASADEASAYGQLLLPLEVVERGKYNT